MKRTVFLSWVFLISFQFFSIAYGQSNNEKSWVISYDIKVQTNKRSASIGDLYDGGSKTIFFNNSKARIRLVSLMRIESIYILPSKDSGIQIFRVKESSKSPSKQKYDWASYKKMYEQYDSAVFTPISDTLTIVGYLCYKGNYQLKNGKILELWYSKKLPSLPAYVDPAFAMVPGLVLKYRYKEGKVWVTYTAGSIKNSPINPAIFDVNQKQSLKIVL